MTAAWKRSFSCPVFNLKRYGKNYGNYRAASFILAPGKLAEKIIKARAGSALRCDKGQHVAFIQEIQFNRGFLIIFVSIAVR